MYLAAARYISSNSGELIMVRTVYIKNQAKKNNNNGGIMDAYLKFLNKKATSQKVKAK